MAKKPLNEKVVNLSLDEYIKPHMRDRFKGKTHGRMCGKRGPHQSQAEKRRRYERSHYFAPDYQRQKQEQQLEALREAMKSMSLDTDSISKLRQGQRRLQDKTTKEMSLLKQRLNGHRQLLLQRQQRQKKQQQLNEASANMETNLTQMPQQLNEASATMKTNLMQQLNEACANMETNLMQQLNEASASMETNLMQQLNEACASMKKNLTQMPQQLNEACASMETNLMQQLNEASASMETNLPQKLEDAEFESVSTKEVIDEIEEQIKEDMDDEINCDVLFIPTNFSLFE